MILQGLSKNVMNLIVKEDVWSKINGYRDRNIQFSYEVLPLTVTINNHWLNPIDLSISVLNAFEIHLFHLTWAAPRQNLIPRYIFSYLCCVLFTCLPLRHEALRKYSVEGQNLHICPAAIDPVRGKREWPIDHPFPQRVFRRELSFLSFLWSSPRCSPLVSSASTF